MLTRVSEAVRNFVRALRGTQGEYAHQRGGSIAGISENTPCAVNELQQLIIRIDAALEAAAGVLAESSRE